MKESGDLNTQRLMFACKDGKLDLVKHYIQNGVRADVDNNWPLFLCCLCGHTTLVFYLLDECEVDPSAGNNKAIGFAAQQGHSAIVKKLLEDVRTDPRKANNYALIEASREGHVDVVEALLNDPFQRSDIAAAQVALKLSRGKSDVLIKALEKYIENRVYCLSW